MDCGGLPPPFLRNLKSGSKLPHSIVMNWLAHLVLSEPTPEFRIGNVLADILPVRELRVLPEAFQAGVAQHRAIDSFTDRHSIFRRSVSRIEPPFRRYGGVVIDIFYDHLLTAHWLEYCPAQLEDFVAQFHIDVEAHRHAIPPHALAILRRMQADEWLTSYDDVAGVRLTLDRIAKRLRRPFDLGGATAYLDRHHDEFDADFVEFFPLIRSQFSVDAVERASNQTKPTHPSP
jgi:acyl carrier protein phosphodiesterase